jgi:dienelactone hydrolase
MTQAPHELEFVLDVPKARTVRELPNYDVYAPADGQLPTVIFVPGPSPLAYQVRPKEWPLFTGYARLLASRGVTAVVLDLPFHNVTEWQEVAPSLPKLVESVRDLSEVDPDRIALWAVSGGAMLVSRWFAESPPWLRCMALTYPFLGTPTETLHPGRPIALTRVGLESPNMQEEVDRFLAKAVSTGTSVHVIDVPNGHHGFDIADHTEESRNAVLAATDFVLGHLTPAR